MESINVYAELRLELKLNLINNLSNRFNYLKNNKIILIATLMDCRFKNLHFSNDEAFKAEQLVKLELNQLSPSSQMQNQVNLSDENDIWNYHDSLIKNTLNEPNELTVYLSLPVKPRNICPIEFWHENQNQFPKLSRIAMKYLIVPATSVPSERLFSKTGTIINEKRSRLKGNKVQQLAILSSLSFNEWQNIKV